MIQNVNFRCGPSPDHKGHANWLMWVVGDPDSPLDRMWGGRVKCQDEPGLTYILALVAATRGLEQFYGTVSEDPLF